MVDLHSNNVELIGTYGSDEIIANSAWVSTSRAGESSKEEIYKLMTHLAENFHESPLEKSLIHFLVTSDVASTIHMLKHRIGVSINSESARYKELKDDKFYIPVDWDEEEKRKLEEFAKLAYQNYHNTVESLVNKGISRSRAKESARYYLPYANQLKQDVTFNMRSFLHFQRLRNELHAQLEIQNIAKNMLELVKSTGKFDITLKTFFKDFLV